MKDKRRKRIIELFNQGYASSWIAEYIGVHESTVSVIISTICLTPKCVYNHLPTKYNDGEKTEEEMLNFAGYKIEDVILEDER
jgi:transposase